MICVLTCIHYHFKYCYLHASEQGDVIKYWCQFNNVWLTFFVAKQRSDLLQIMAIDFFSVSVGPGALHLGLY